jgi:BlaI family transcriptional regulator, penicillinase repressor
MPRKKSVTLGGREAEIMGILWRLGPSSAEAIRALMGGDPHDSSVRTVLRVLEEKGHVAHTMRGRTYIYRPRGRQASAQRKALEVLMARLFGGSAENLVLRLLEDEAISPGELRELAESLEKRDRRDS